MSAGLSRSIHFHIPTGQPERVPMISNICLRGYLGQYIFIFPQVNLNASRWYLLIIISVARSIHFHIPSGQPERLPMISIICLRGYLGQYIFIFPQVNLNASRWYLLIIISVARSIHFHIPSGQPERVPMISINNYLGREVNTFPYSHRSTWTPPNDIYYMSAGLSRSINFHIPAGQPERVPISIAGCVDESTAH
jgi:hypothetical protein